MEPKTIRVRIAVAVSPQGHWESFGSTVGVANPENGDDATHAEYAVMNCDGKTHAVHFIEADIPLPVAVTVEGTVTK